MNPAEWEDAIRRVQTHPGTDRAGVNNSVGNVFPASNNTYCDYSTNEPHSSMEMNVRWEEISSPSCNFYGTRSDVEESEGEPLEMHEEDMLLERKQKELREIEERIMFKKASIAFKTYEPLLLSPPGLSSNEQPVTCTVETLRDRVNLILQQRHSPSSLSQFQSPKKRMNSFRLRKDGLLIEDHPLKLRVNALMKQRHYDPCVTPTPANMKVPVVELPPSSQTVTSPAEEERNSSSAGFQRFLSVLNKGVDIDLLSRIVTDDSEDLALDEGLLNIQSDPVRSQQSNSSTSLLGRSRTDSGERKSGTSSGDRLSLTGGKDRKSDRGDGSFASSSRSRSPLAAKKRKKEEKTKMDEQHEHLQNILKTLGLSLEVEEMSKLADRTLERLYGKKHESARGGADGRREQESRQRRSQRYNWNSPSSSMSSDSDSDSSSSSSSSSRSSSRSFSHSPARRSLSHGSNTRRRCMPERSSEDGQTHKDGNEEDKDAHALREKDKGEYPYPLDGNYSHPHPAAFSSFPDYNLPLYSQYSAYHSGTYSSGINSSSSYTQGAVPPSVDYSWSPYQPGSVVPNVVYPHHDPFEDINLLVNPDLSTSEGQTGAAGSRCLRVISTKPTNQRCVTQLTKSYKRKAKYIRKCRAWFAKLKKRKKNNKMSTQPVMEVQRRSQRIAERMAQLATQQEKDVSETQPSKEEKQELTEEEIKANLRKKLEAFNQRVKQQVTHPAAPQSSHTELQ